jgi:hypothetical protein
MRLQFLWGSELRVMARRDDYLVFTGVGIRAPWLGILFVGPGIRVSHSTILVGNMMD